MDILNTLLELCNFGINSGVDCNTAVESSTTIGSALGNLGGIGNIITMFCQLLGIGC